MDKQICVIGGGRWGENHIRTLREMGNLGAVVEKGDPMGYFLFGGSDIVMIFQEGVQLGKILAKRVLAHETEDALKAYADFFEI